MGRYVQDAPEEKLEKLDEVFEAMVERINRQLKAYADLAMRSLMFLSLVKRPFLVEELKEALAIKEKDRALDEDGCSSMTIIIDYSQGLIMVENASGTTLFVHYTVQEYFETNETSLFPEGEDKFTRICLTYLLFSTFEGGIPLEVFNTMATPPLVKSNPYDCSST